jgi:uncharacterized protein (DUF736 family)
VNGLAAAEDPDVDVTTAAPDVRLDVGEAPPITDLWKQYDDDNDDFLSLTEVLDALDDGLTSTQLISVLEFYFSQAP